MIKRGEGTKEVTDLWTVNWIDSHGGHFFAEYHTVKELTKELKEWIFDDARSKDHIIIYEPKEGLGVDYFI